MAEFTYGFGFRPKEYIAESLLDLVGKTPILLNLKEYFKNYKRKL